MNQAPYPPTGGAAAPYPPTGGAAAPYPPMGAAPYPGAAPYAGAAPYPPVGDVGGGPQPPFPAMMGAQAGSGKNWLCRDKT